MNTQTFTYGGVTNTPTTAMKGWGIDMATLPVLQRLGDAEDFYFVLLYIC